MFGLFGKKHNKVSDLELNKSAVASVVFLNGLRHYQCSMFLFYRFLRNSKLWIGNDYWELVNYLELKGWIEGKKDAVAITDTGRIIAENSNLSKLISEEQSKSIDRNIAFINAHYVENISKHILKKEDTRQSLNMRNDNKMDKEQE